MCFGWTSQQSAFISLHGIYFYTGCFWSKLPYFRYVFYGSHQRIKFTQTCVKHVLLKQIYFRTPFLQFLKHSKPSNYYIYHQIQQYKTQNLPTQCIYMFCVDLTTKWLYFLYTELNFIQGVSDVSNHITHTCSMDKKQRIKFIQTCVKGPISFRCMTTLNMRIQEGQVYV